MNLFQLPNELSAEAEEIWLHLSVASKLLDKDTDKIFIDWLDYNMIFLIKANEEKNLKIPEVGAYNEKEMIIRICSNVLREYRGHFFTLKNDSNEIKALYYYFLAHISYVNSLSERKDILSEIINDKILI